MIANYVTLYPGVSKPCIERTRAGDQTHVKPLRLKLKRRIDGNFGLPTIDPSKVVEDHDVIQLGYGHELAVRVIDQAERFISNLGSTQ